MNAHFKSSLRPAWSAWIGLVGAVLAVVALAIAGNIGAIQMATAQRMIGLVFGVAIVIVGNALPKMRPFNWLQVNATSMPVERLSGWILVLAGFAWSGLFLFISLEEAKHAASLIGLGALAVVAMSWIWLSGKALARRRNDSSIGLSHYAVRKWQVSGWLLFAFFNVLVIMCVKFLVDDKQKVNEWSLWIVSAFWLVYAALHAAFRTR